MLLKQELPALHWQGFHIENMLKPLYGKRYKLSL